MIYDSDEFLETLIKIIKTSHTHYDGSVSEHTGYRHPCYAEACKHAEEMSWHLYGDKPEDLLRRARPREDPAVTQYRLENYEPTTKSAADKAINIVSKIFNPNLYSIRWKDQTTSGKKLEEYTLLYYPVGNSIVNYAKDVLLRKMLADPSAVAVVKLEKIPESQTEEVKPVMSIYGCHNVWNYDLDHYLIFINTEVEKQQSGPNITWYYFEYYDKDQYVNFRCYLTPETKLVIEDIKVYPYLFDEVPVWQLKGLSEVKDNGEIIYKSFFASAARIGICLSCTNRMFSGAYIQHIHPQKHELSEPCSYKFQWQGLSYPCKNGSIRYGSVDGPSEVMSCPSCDGSGFRNMAGPYGVYKISKEKLQEGDGPIGIDPVGYVNVPVDATKMLEERADRMRQMGMWAINMDVEDEVGENQSGVAKAIDRSAQYDTLYNIGSVIFDVHLTNFYYFTNKYMGVADVSKGGEPDKNLPEINKPTQFDIGSTTELINNYKVAKESGLDPNYLQIKQIEIQSWDLTTNPDLKKFASLILDLDPLPGMDAQTISLNASKGFVRQVDAVVHFNIKRFIERAMKEQNNFMELPKDEQVVILEGYGDEFVKENKPQIDPNLLNYAAPTRKVQAKEKTAA